MAIASAMLLAGSIPLVHNLIWVPDSLAAVQEYAAMIADAPCRDAGEMYILPIMDKLWDGAFVLCTGGSVISITYGCITFCNYNVQRVIKQSSHWSKSARAVQSQLNAAILFQAMTPLAVVVVPVFGAIAVITTGSEQIRVLSQFATTSLAWIPVMNPISTIIFIKAYRRAVLNLLPRRVATVSDCEQPPQAETMANNSTLFDGPTIS
ncbi:7TM GPCR protein [Aphelenchoides avenae]|nr:7TM GPCR protein [Aphelenchus avenae]